MNVATQKRKRPKRTDSLPSQDFGPDSRRRTTVNEQGYPVSVELGADLMRRERHQRAAEDRRRTEELARLRALQGRD